MSDGPALVFVSRRQRDIYNIPDDVSIIDEIELGKRPAKVYTGRGISALMSSPAPTPDEAHAITQLAALEQMEAVVAQCFDEPQIAMASC